MSKGLVSKLLILLFGVLLVLLGVLYQIKQNSAPAPVAPTDKKDMATVMAASLQLQRRYFQRCWLRGNSNTAAMLHAEDATQLTWQIFLTIESSGKVKDFSLINKGLFDAETEKCLKEISYRLKFPSFEGEDIAISVPIVISNINENR